MEYKLSIVSICPDESRAVINALAEQFGAGQDNMSVKLIDQKGDVWWGCHSWWKQEDYAFFKSEIASSSNSETQASLNSLIESVVEEGEPHEHWIATLSKHNLKQVMYDLDGNEVLD